MKLADLDQKNSAIIVNIMAGKKATQRIMDMGLCIGTAFKVVTKLPNGPIEVNVRDTNLIIGHVLAEKIIVELKQGVPR